MNLLGRILLEEGKETKNMSAAKHYLYDRLGYTEQQAMQLIGKIKTDIPNSRLGKCKFMLGIVRMHCDGELSDGSTKMDLNKALKYVASDSHINEYDQNLNGLDASQLIDKFSEFGQRDLELDKESVSSEEYDEQNSIYEIVKINSFDDATEYSEYVDWCVTQEEEMYDSYTKNGYGVFYFCLRNGYESEQRIEGEGCPLDDYGLSMIAVSVNSDGSCNTITCRWNHDNGGNDHIMTPKELSSVIGRNFYNSFKPLTSEEINRNLRYQVEMAQEEIYEYGINYTDCDSLEYDEYYGDKDPVNLYVYHTQRGKEVVINEDNELIIDMVFDKVYDRDSDVIEVESSGKQNFLTTQGVLLGKNWFSKVCNRFRYGYGLVCNGNKWNAINMNGEFLFSKWYTYIDYSYGNKKFIEYGDNGKYNFFNLETHKPVFDRSIKRTFRANSDNLFICFDGESVFYVYNPHTMLKKAPWVIKSLLGHYRNFYHIELTDGKEYLIDNSLNLYDFKTFEKIKDNPYLNENKLYRNTIRLRESELRRMISESVRRILNESEMAL